MGADKRTHNNRSWEIFRFLLEPTLRYSTKSRGGEKKGFDGFENLETYEDPEEIELAKEIQAIAAFSSATKLPEELFAYVKFGYDLTLKGKLESENKSFGPWVKEVMCHVQAHFRHSSLTTKIQFKVFKEIALQCCFALLKIFLKPKFFVIVYLISVLSLIRMTQFKKTKTSQVLKMRVFVNGQNTHLKMLKGTLKLIFLWPLDTIHQN